MKEINKETYEKLKKQSKRVVKTKHKYYMLDVR